MINIAIDGPTASGKSTIAKKVAETLGYRYIDTGAMFRCVAYGAICAGIDLTDEEAVSAFAIDAKIDFVAQRAWLNNQDVEDAIRTSEMGVNASIVGQYKRVRHHLKIRQQSMIREGGIVMDGRDIGTVVMPDAQLKIYQVAEVETRAKRRYLDLLKQNPKIEYKQVLEDLVLRDKQDTQRIESPLVKAKDAIVLDTTHLTIEQSVNEIVKQAKKRGA